MKNKETKANKNPVGRPLERPGAKKIMTKLDASTAAKLERLAQEAKRTVHSLASDVLDQWVLAQAEPIDPRQEELAL